MRCEARNTRGERCAHEAIFADGCCVYHTRGALPVCFCGRAVEDRVEHLVEAHGWARPGTVFKGDR